jgi:RNA recognition motif-containing protein
MSTKLYVGGLPWATTQDDLLNAFQGASSAQIITDRATGRSKGFGFVTYEDEAMAMAAVEQWNGADFNGRRLIVDVARPMEDRPPRTGGSSRPSFGGQGGRPQGGRSFGGGRGRE